MRIFTTHQAARILGVSLTTLYRYIYSGELKAHKMGRFTKRKHWKIGEDDLNNFISGNGKGE